MARPNTDLGAVALTRLPPAQLRRVDLLARVGGVTRSEFLRRAVLRAVEQESDRLLALADLGLNDNTPPREERRVAKLEGRGHDATSSNLR